MGRGIAIAFLQAGYPVTLLETTHGALELGLEKVRAAVGSLEIKKVVIVQGKMVNIVV